MTASGFVFNIQRFSLHDGPGLRTTVFLKGCPLRCEWCHNPEGLSFESQITTLGARCTGCGRCRKVCRNENCISCGECVGVCLSGARRMIGKRLNVGDVLEAALKDRLYYEESGGGVTFSGGEPLAQPEFLGELLDACRAEFLHTAIETSGYAPWSVLEAIASRTDLLLYDIKGMDDRLHRRHTGRSNRLILDNLQKLGEIHRNIIVRLPVIPGCNDSAEQRAAAMAFARSIKGVRDVRELPYHELGRHKAVVSKPD